MMKCKGFDANSLMRAYAQRVMTNELPIPADDHGFNIVPLGDENVVTSEDFVRMVHTSKDPDFRNSKQAN